MDKYVNDCKHVFAFETRTFPADNYDCVWYASLQMGAGTIEFGTGAQNAAQGIGHISDSLWLGWVLGG